MKKLFAVLALFAAVVLVAAQEQQFHPPPCNSGFGLCDGVCFDPARFSCMNNRIICDRTMNNLCGSDLCYDSSTHKCYHNETLCRISDRICGKSCYDPALSDCEELRFACGKDDLVCLNTLKFINKFFENILDIVKAIWNVVQNWDLMKLWNMVLNIVLLPEDQTEPPVAPPVTVIPAAPDTTCPSGFGGDSCNIPICFSQLANDVNVCNGHGVCSAPDTCVCSQGFSGDRCNQACAGTPPAQECPQGFGGEGCLIPICFSQLANDVNVCNGNGNCTGPDTCVCKEGFRGDRCDQVCAPVPPPAPSCPTGYGGDNCSIPICFSQLANDINVCSGHGNCTAPDMCVCEQPFHGDRCDQECLPPPPPPCPEGFGGEDCSLPICFSQMANDTNVCSGHGNCTAPDTCVCTEGFSGDRCDQECTPTPPAQECPQGFGGEGCLIPICFSQLANDVNVCNGNGNCTGPDTCVCKEGFEGERCDQIITPPAPSLRLCSNVTCPEGEICCDDRIVGALCYKPGEHTCTLLPDGKLRFCCCATCLPCGDDFRCYNTRTHSCLNNQVIPLDRLPENGGSNNN